MGKQQKAPQKTPQKTSTLKKKSDQDVMAAVDHDKISSEILKNDSTKKKRDIRLRLNLKNHCGGYWFHQKWYLLWVSDKSEESLRAMHRFHDKLVSLEYTPRMYDGFNDPLKKDEYRSRHWRMNSSETETPTAVPGRVRPWNGMMVWELKCTRSPEYMPETDLNKEFFDMLNQMKKLTQEFNFGLQEEKWRFSEIFKEEGLYSNNPEEWKDRRKHVDEFGCGPLKDVISGKYLYYHM